MVELKKKTTEQIIEELRRGMHREANYKLLFERYHDQVYRFFQRNGMAREDCRDLTQDVFVSVHNSLKTLRDQTQFQTWLFTIARNIFRNELERRQARKRTGAILSLEERQGKTGEGPLLVRKATDPRNGPMEALLEKERREKLTEAMKRLPPQMQRCVQLRTQKGLAMAEIAAVMRISVNTVKAHLHQARKVLKEDLGEHLNDNEL
jgi:RNA polymerase sigma-70 factor (ECF subfamily)